MSRRLVYLPVLSALLYLLAFPRFYHFWTAWIALAPLALAVERLPKRQAFLLGWLAGTLAYIGILYWIIVTFQAAHLSVMLACLCLILLAGYIGLYWGAWAWFVSLSPVSFWWAIRGAAAWVTLEYLRTHLFSGFPWALLADSQVKYLSLIQIASVTGVYGVSFLVAIFNLSIAQIFGSPIRGKGKNTALIMPWVGGLLFFCVLLGHQRRTQEMAASHAPGYKVALLQGNIDQYKKWDKAYVADIQETYLGLVKRAVLAKPDLIVWPETSVPGYLLQDKPLHDWLQSVVRNSHTSHLLGSPSIDGKEAYNAAFSVDPEGRLINEYDKQHLVPFGEIVPCASVLGRFIRVLNELGGFTAGTRSPVMPIAGARIGVNICYEMIFPNLVRKSVRQGAQIIANLTNDGWYMRTAAPIQHWAPSVYRAIENDRWVIRADNTGVSGVIDPRGRIVAVSAIFEPAVVIGIVEPRTGLTPYTRFGDLFAWCCLCLCAATILLYILRPL